MKKTNINNSVLNSDPPAQNDFGFKSLQKENSFYSETKNKKRPEYSP